MAVQLAVSAGLGAGLSGCASDQSAAYQVARSIVRPNAGLDARPLNPDLRYLRVTANGKASLMVLGYVDQDASGRPVQVWYSAMGEVLRLRDGRLAGLVGTAIEWRGVAWPAGLPAWSAAAAAPVSYERLHDEMPAYRVQLKEQIRLTPVSAPGGTELQGVRPSDLAWFEETAVDGRSAPARYGVKMGTSSAEAHVVYGEQCLSADVCLAWQVWPPTQGMATR